MGLFAAGTPAGRFQGDVVINGALQQSLGKVSILGDMTAGVFQCVGLTCDGGLHVGGSTTLAALQCGSVTCDGIMSTSDIACTGDISLTHADCAEDFDVGECEDAQPGTVMVINNEGILIPSSQAYDRRVAGVVSGAGGLKPGIVLDRASGRARTPIALIGKVYCQVDATHSPIQVGDLLTTSAMPGHAMKAADPMRAFGSVIGKALQPLLQGQGIIPVLVALQ